MALTHQASDKRGRSGEATEDLHTHFIGRKGVSSLQEVIVQSAWSHVPSVLVLLERLAYILYSI